MNILVVGEAPSHAEFKAKFKDYHPTVYKNSLDITSKDLTGMDVVFDFSMEDDIHGSFYSEYPKICFFLNSVKTTLVEIRQRQSCPQLLVGFNGIQGLFDRPLLELVLNKPSDQTRVKEICTTLETDYVVVADRVGMVTPRVLCMIINEAYYTVQEGTAVANDIDLGMKLGTRYPAGPFEFCESIGIQQVYEILDALYHDTKDERYKICPQLKKDYLLKENL